MLAAGLSPLQLLPVALLVTGIAVHGVRIVAFDEDPQRGSGFAMFATVDVATTRRVLVTIPSDPPIKVEIPTSLVEQRDSLVETPSDSAARELAKSLLEEKWEIDGETATSGGGTALDRLRVEVVSLEVDGRTFRRRIFTDLVVQRGGS